MPPDSSFQLFSGTDAGNTDVFYVEVEVQPDGTTEARVQLRRPDDSFAPSAWAPIDPNGTDDIAVTWEVEGDDAVARLWVGQEYRDIKVAGAGIGATVESLSVGAKSLVLGAPATRGGTLLVDDVLFTY